MFVTPFDIFPVNLLQLMLASIMLFTLSCLYHLPRYKSLSGLFLFQAIVCVVNVLEGLNISKEFYLLSPVFTLLSGPVLYFFVSSLVNTYPLLGKGKWLHFLCAFLALPFTEHTQLIIALGSLSQIIYLALSFKLLHRYRQSTNAVRSDACSYQLNWTFAALTVFSLLIIADLVRMNLQSLVNEELKFSWYFLNELCLFFVFSYLAFKVIRQPKLFDGMSEYEQQAEHKVTANAEQEISIAKQIFSAVDTEIQQKKLYSKPRFSITELAAETGFKVKDISWAINQISQRNFCDYINHLRVLAVQKDLEQGDLSTINILETAFSCGFNSKSSFNAVFRREVAMTPSQYLKKNTQP